MDVVGVTNVTETRGSPERLGRRVRVRIGVIGTGMSGELVVPESLGMEGRMCHTGRSERGNISDARLFFFPTHLSIDVRVRLRIPELLILVEKRIEKADGLLVEHVGGLARGADGPARGHLSGDWRLIGGNVLRQELHDVAALQCRQLRGRTVGHPERETARSLVRLSFAVRCLLMCFAKALPV